MRAVIIDDEYHAISELAFYLNKLDIDIIGKFTSAEEGYEFFNTQSADVVFLDIDMPGHNGLDLGKHIFRHHKKVAIVYVTAHPRYALESFSAHPVDFIIKPVDERRLEEAIDLIRSRLDERKEEKKKLRINCYGKFQVFSGDEEIKFTTGKSKELLAFIITHYNKPNNKAEIIRYIFDTGDENKDSNNFRVSLFRLRHSLQEAQVDKNDLLVRDDCSIHLAQNVCDLVDFDRFMKENTIIDNKNIGEAVRLIDNLRDELLTDIGAFWVIDERADFIKHAEDIIWKTSMYYREIGENLKAEYVLLKLIEMNPISEIGYTSILDICIETHNRGKFMHYYKRYQKVMNEELQCVPEKKYRDLYDRYL